jgi:trans-aconitate methyltransferase
MPRPWLRHDVTTGEFPESSFDLVHVRAVFMHITGRMAALRRMVSWLAPGGWLLVEEPDFGMWLGDFDPIWAAHPRAWHEAFPKGSMSQGRAILRQIHSSGWKTSALTPNSTSSSQEQRCRSSTG